jgi:hypothetical protein
MLDFAEVFGLPKSTFASQKKLSCESFLQLLEKKRINLTPLRQAKPMIIAMVALNPVNPKEEKQAILAALNKNKHLDNYIYENLPKEKEYFVVDKAFWDSWCQAINWMEETEFGLKIDRPLGINNLSLMEPNHQFRMKDLVYK